MTTTQDTPRTIRASIDDSVLERITSFFNAGLEDIINEMLQNARRSGATVVDITQEGGIITVEDDGCGIADPQVLLSFGRTDWTDDMVQHEHPAGMGIYALSRANTVTIQSKVRGEPAWWVDLIPQHFKGKEYAHVSSAPNYDPSAGQGTSVSFTWADDAESCVMKASWYFPLPVFFNGREIEREDFLGNALYVREWQGLRFGVYRERFSGYALRNMNFHGIVISNKETMPNVPTLEPYAHYHACIDVIDCPGLELTLPARKEVVSTPYLADVKDAALETIYRCIAESDQPEGMPKKVQDDARRFGISIPDPAARLNVWQARSYTDDDFMGDPKPVMDVTDDCLLGRYLDWPEQQTLARALASNAAPPIILEGEGGKLGGYEWYDRLDRIDGMTVSVTFEDETWEFDGLMDPSEREIEGQRPDEIKVILDVVKQDGSRYQLTLDSDVALPDDQGTFCDEVQPLIKVGSDINPGDLADMLMNGYFDPSDGPDQDSSQTQEEYAEQSFLRACEAMLVSKETAIMRAVHDDIRHSSVYGMPVGTVVMIKVGERNSVDIEVQVPETEQVQETE